MNNEINDGGPAFPCPVGHMSCAHPEGMSLRDWFAGQALAGLCANPDINCNVAEDYLAAIALERADAMLKARGKE